tara:strand:+ start:2022 stop:2234 length:213 start_codon:yes stop_codon:yes gene_type:complete
MTRTINIDVDDLICTILLLDAAQEALDIIAEREKRREAGKRMRSITDQQRAKTTRAHVAKMMVKYGLEIN